jgi:dienelactone hydrolase
MRPSALAAVLCVTLAGPAWAQSMGPPGAAMPLPERVEFESAARPLGRLQERLARERGEDSKPTPGVRLEGYLAKPEGNGPFPGVVVMPGCAGLTSFVKETLPGILALWGYAALVVDSLATRKVEPNCVKDHASVDRLSDAYGGLFYLAGLPFMDRNRIGVLGVSIGGRTALVLADPSFEGTVANPGKLTFKAGVAYYPTCTVSNQAPRFPLLVMVGRSDRDCEPLVARRAGNPVPTDLVVYPDADHGFLERDWGSGQDAFGARFQYDEGSAEDSLKRTREFLARNLNARQG